MSKKENTFIHLNTHSDFSLLKGYSTVDELISKAQENNQQAIALTDCNSMIAMYKWITKCQKVGIKPIAGVEINMAPKSELGAKEKKSIQYDGSKPYIVNRGTATHLTLLAKNITGLRNLYKLIRISYLPENNYMVPRIDMNILKEYSEGLVCLSGDPYSEINIRLRLGQFNEAAKEVAILKEIFKDDFYIELVPVKGPQDYSLENLIKLALHTKTQVVLTNNVYYCNKEDAEMQARVMAMGNKNKWDETPSNLGGLRFVFNDNERYLKSQSEMIEYLKEHYPNIDNKIFSIAIKNTQVINEKIENIELEYDSHLRPPVDLPGAFNNSYDYIKHLITEGFNRKRAKKCSNEVKKESKRRIQHELEVLNSNDFIDYFLTVKDYLDYSRKIGYDVGVARGSAAGSEIAYLLDISRVDPIKFDLMFERFISPGRGAIYEITYTNSTKEELNVAEVKFVNNNKKYIYELNVGDKIDSNDGEKEIKHIKIIDAGSPPDVDADVHPQARHLLIEYVQKKYGYENVAALITPGEFIIKNSWKSMCTLYDISSTKANQLSQLLPAGHQGETLSNLLQSDNKDGEDFRLALDSPKLREAAECASKLQGRQRESGVHACGIVISKQPLTNTIPIQIRDDGLPVTQYNYAECESLGLIKMDFLGLATLELIQSTIEMVNKTRGTNLKAEDIINSELDDLEVFKMFQEGNSFGIFQFSEPGVRELLKKVKPTEFMELAAITALYRPGPMGMGLHEDFAKRKNDEKARIPVHSSFKNTQLEEILKPTLGALVFQEQVMKIAQECAGFNSKDADGLRKAMGKKKKAIVDSYEPKFKQGMKDNGYNDENAVNILWDGLVGFSEYAFNKSHSVSYAINSYQSAFLKVHYPVEFMTALLRQHYSGSEASKYIEEIKRLGINLLPPSINDSELDITPLTDKQSIVYGLSCLKGLQQDVINKILEERHKNGVYKDLEDFIKRNEYVSSSIFKKLTAAGCFDGFGYNRHTLFKHADTILKQVKIANSMKAGNLLFNMINNNRSVINFPQEKEWSNSEKIKYEASVIGMYLSGNPLSLIKLNNNVSLDNQINLNEITEDTIQYVTFMSVKTGKTKGGKRYLDVTMNNGSSQRDFKVFGKVMDSITLQLAINKAKKENPDCSSPNKLKELAFNIMKISDDKIDYWNNLSPINMPIPFTPYKVEFKCNYGSKRLFIEKLSMLQLSNNDRILKTLKIKNSCNLSLEQIKNIILSNADNKFKQSINEDLSDIIIYDKTGHSLQLDDVYLDKSLFTEVLDELIKGD